MAFNLEELGGRAGEITSAVFTGGLMILGGLICIAIFGCIMWWAMKRKRWNLIVEVKMPRTDGQVILRERAKGHFDIAAGVVDIKRKKLKAVGMKPFDIRKYLQGNNYLEVMQIGPEDYIPLLPKSYTKLVNEIDGEDCAIMEIETNLGKRKTWKNYMERAAKNRFTLIGFLDKHWRAIEISIILFVIFLGMAILWMRMPSICG